MNAPRTDALLNDPGNDPYETGWIEHARELETELADVKKELADAQSDIAEEIKQGEIYKAKLEKCRAALGGISEYGKMCKGTDAARMKYLADQAIGQTE